MIAYADAVGVGMNIDRDRYARLRAAAATMSTRPLALVTGAGKRLGLTITETLIEAGWDVLALVRTRTPALDTLLTAGGVRANYRA